MKIFKYTHAFDTHFDKLSCVWYSFTNYYNYYYYSLLQQKNEDSDIWAKFSEEHLAWGQENWLGAGCMGL